MRLITALAPWAALLVAGCGTSTSTAGAGSSIPPVIAGACDAFGLEPGTPEFERCAAARRQRDAAGTRGVVDTLFRGATQSPVR